MAAPWCVIEGKNRAKSSEIGNRSPSYEDDSPGNQKRRRRRCSGRRKRSGGDSRWARHRDKGGLQSCSTVFIGPTCLEAWAARSHVAIGLGLKCCRYKKKIFLHFFQINFAKYMVRKNNFAKLYIWRRAGRRQGPTAVPYGGRKACGTAAPPTAVGHGGRGPVSFRNFVMFLFELESR
jgi:hypothetical protein